GGLGKPRLNCQFSAGRLRGRRPSFLTHLVARECGEAVEPDQKVNILLVDDKPAKLLVLESILADLGQNLVKADSAREALRYLLSQDFAMILLDVNMPGMDGFELAELIRHRQRSEHTP